jgi:hypothetical protein
VNGIEYIFENTRGCTLPLLKCLFPAGYAITSFVLQTVELYIIISSLPAPTLPSRQGTEQPPLRVSDLQMLQPLSVYETIKNNNYQKIVKQNLFCYGICECTRMRSC